jgi:hypothetical protein
LRHFRNARDAGICRGRVGQSSIRIRRRRWHLNLGGCFGDRSFIVSGTECPLGRKKHYHEHHEQPSYQTYSRVAPRARVRSRPGNSRYLRHFCLIAVGWGLVRHLICCALGLWNFCRWHAKNAEATKPRATTAYCKAVNHQGQQRKPWGVRADARYCPRRRQQKVGFEANGESRSQGPVECS